MQARQKPVAAVTLPMADGPGYDVPELSKIIRTPLPASPTGRGRRAMSGANARRVRDEFTENVVGVLRPSPNPLPERDLLVSGFALSSLLSPKNVPSEMVQGLGLVHRLLFNRLRLRILDGCGL